MFRRWFESSGNTADWSQVEVLLKTIAYGRTLDKQRLIYAYESLAEEVCLDCLQSLEKLHWQTSETLLQDRNPFQQVAQYPSGRFLLLILQVPWLVEPDKNCPLLLAKHKGQWCIVGLSQPWVGILAEFSDRELRQMQTLSATWVQYLA
jgi:hypothetical protein